jgi:hypothetical protein
MSEREVIKTRDGWRAVIVLDEDAEPPYDEGSTPILAWSYREGLHARQVTEITPYRVPPTIVAALLRWHNDTDLFERYLRMFHGTTSVEWRSTDHMDFVTFDSADWRESVDQTAETAAWLAAQGATPRTTSTMAEFLAWCEGDVWGFVIEEEVTWQRTDGRDITMMTWEPVDSCWGYYGEEYARQTALEVLDSYGQRRRDV